MTANSVEPVYDPYGCGDLHCGHGSCYANRRLMTGTWGLMVDPYKNRRISHQEAVEASAKGFGELMKLQGKVAGK